MPKWTQEDQANFDREEDARMLEVRRRQEAERFRAQSREQSRNAGYPV